MSTLRPLPPRPNLAFERKEAKVLLRRLRAGDPKALARARARHPTLPDALHRVRLGRAAGDRCGADLDLNADPDRKRSHPYRSARELAHDMFEQNPGDAEYRRIAELCGLDPEAILAEPVTPPVVAPPLQEALELAGDDAFLLGQPDVRPENLFFGLLRAGGPPLYWVTQVSRVDLDRFRADVAARVRPAADRVEHPRLAMHPDAQAAIEAAVASATERAHNGVWTPLACDVQPDTTGRRPRQADGVGTNDGTKRQRRTALAARVELSSLDRALLNGVRQPPCSVTFDSYENFSQ